MIALQTDNPFQEEGAIYGLVPTGSGVKVELDVLEELFRRNGDERVPLFGGLPSCVQHADNVTWDAGTNMPILHEAEARNLIWSVFPAIAGNASEVRLTCEMLRQYPTDPWG